MKTKYLAEAAVIAAIYALLTIVLAPISYGAVQVRISEALTVLPFFTPAAVPGLFVGCIAANIMSPYGPCGFDIRKRSVAHRRNWLVSFKKEAASCAACTCNIKWNNCRRNAVLCI